MSIISEIIHNFNENRLIYKLAKFQTFTSSAISTISIIASKCFKAKNIETFEKAFRELNHFTKCYSHTIAKMSTDCINFGCNESKVNAAEEEFINCISETFNDAEEMRRLITM